MAQYLGIQVRDSLKAVALMSACSSCDYMEYTTEVGDYVVYHWDVDAWATEGAQLCGGTVDAADRFVAGIATYYGWPLPKNGPTIEYFWDRGLTNIACPPPHQCTFGALALTGAQVFAIDPFETHELAHAAAGFGNLGGIGPGAFIDEAFAMRWESGLASGWFAPNTLEDFLSEVQLRAQLAVVSHDDVDVYGALTWWFALETTYGPIKMAEFIAELSMVRSPNEVDRTLQRVFGISLADSVVLAEDLPAQYIQDPACEFVGLPSLAWNANESLVIDRGDAHCGDDDIVNLVGHGSVTWLVELKFPISRETVDVHVTASEGEQVVGKSLVMAKCDDEVHGFTGAGPYDYFPAKLASEPVPHRQVNGRYIAGLRDVDVTNGKARFPRVVIKPSSQP
jgi:hypothetical protein